ncbi:MAG: aminotransferase class IV, partial [Bacteroidota bacterium]
MSSICFNGKIMPADAPVLMASNRSYRYGDGLFETMKLANGKIALADYHFERLFSGLSLLQFEVPKLFVPEKLEQEILLLARKNNCEQLARIRLSVFRGNGGLYDDDRTLQYVMECWPLSEPVNQLNENGLVVDIFPDARKSCDQFSNLKSANFLPYSMAALFAKENKLNDCFVLNTHKRICDATVANIFWIKDGNIFTPPLLEGCVNGVMRRYLLEKMRDAGYGIQEIPANVSDLKSADEVFLSNAVNGIRWVGQFRSKKYGNTTTVKIYNDLVRTI